MKILGPEVFELATDESFTVRIECEGGAYLAFGSVNNEELSFNEDTPEAQVTPAILAGPNTINRVHLHLVYPEDAPPDSYQITVIDRNGDTVDSINSTLNSDRTRPYRVDVDLIAQVE